MRTLGQKRAEFALSKVVGIPQDKKNKFKPFSAGAPSMILQNGFGQALAFWISKSKDEHMAMLDIVKEWLCQNNLATGQSKTDFILNISQMDQTRYLTAQKETLALLEWVKRYTNAGL
ncbi:MAG: type III-B CRISPR module-associated protein Cmr5 [Deltaproteobacteria bacterium]|nr:type III-B CRISPR module-associated protein Cmr5 [Deltaproteobacteria bacterium]